MIVSDPPGSGTGSDSISPVKHLIVVILQNHSFDSLFATFPGVADPLSTASPGFSQPNASNTGTITPFLLTDPFPKDMPHGGPAYENSIDGGKMDGFAQAENTTVAMGHYDNTITGVDLFWSYAQQYSLADNFFMPEAAAQPNNGIMMIAAVDTGHDYGSPPMFGPCSKPADPTAVALTTKNVGDEMNDAGVTWGWFHEKYGVCADYSPPQNPFQYFTDMQNSPNLQDIEGFYSELDNGTLPSVSFLVPGGTHNCHPGNSSITACGSYIDDLIREVQNSPKWSETAVLVLWDEGGGFYDHVPPPTVGGIPNGVRLPMMVISPYAKTGYISHVQMDQVSILRFIQWNWKLPNLNTRNAAPGPTIELRDMFTF
jgi:phospholipase C